MNFISEFWEKIKTIDVPFDKIIQPIRDMSENPNRTVFFVIAMMCLAWFVFRRVIDARRDLTVVDSGYSNKIVIVVFLISFSLSVGWDFISDGSSEMFDLWGDKITNPFSDS